MPKKSMSPAVRFEPSLLQQAQPVRIVFLDVDGVLTDGGLQFTEHGESMKRFNTLDGHGIKLLQKTGVVVAVVTGRDSAPLRLRLKQLGVEQVVYGTEDKLPAAQSILNTLGLTWSQAAMMGDDWPDLPVMQRCAFACAPSNAHPENLGVADFVTSAKGGHGAVRELCDLLLVATGRYSEMLKAYQP